MKTLYKITYSFCFLITSCQSMLQQSDDYDVLANRETLSFAREVKTTDQLKLIKYGGGFLDCINKLSIGFSSPYHPNIDEARFLYFDIATRFLDRVNQNEALRPYLVNYPFTMENLDLLIIFPRDVIGSITGVGMGESFPNHKRDFVYYDAYDPSIKKIAIVYKELYEEAVRRYEQQKSAISQSCETLESQN